MATRSRRVTSQSSRSIRFREAAVGRLTTEIGVYVLSDLDDVPIYVGQTIAVKESGIRGRVQRHLTSARSDMIANRQLDVWEIAFVRAWPVTNRDKINALEAALFHEYDPQSTLMNGKIPAKPPTSFAIPEPFQRVQVIDDEEIALRATPSLRLPRQAAHYGQLVGHYLTVKDSKQMARSMRAHFERLVRYHQRLLEESGPELTGHNE